MFFSNTLQGGSTLGVAMVWAWAGRGFHFTKVTLHFTQIVYHLTQFSCTGGEGGPKKSGVGRGENTFGPLILRNPPPWRNVGCGDSFKMLKPCEKCL